MIDNKIRLVAHAAAWFDTSSTIKIKSLMLYQSSATRSAYQAIYKHNLEGNDVKKYVKQNYMKHLNQRYVSDACSIASGIKQNNAIFGGKKLWKEMVKGSISKTQWQDASLKPH